MLTIFRKKQCEIELQIAEYHAWRERMYETCAIDECRWVRDFFEYCKKESVSSVRISDITAYHRYVVEEYKTRHSENSAIRALGCFFAYFHARNFPCLSRASIRTATLAPNRQVRVY
jgi:hypothetical protein